MALPQDITYVMGLRDTGDAGSVSIDPKQPFTIGKEIWRLNPNKHQLLSWVMKNSRYRPTKTHKFGHLEKAPLPNWVTYIGPNESSQDTSNVLFENAATRLTTGSRMYVARTGEVMRVTAGVTSPATVDTLGRNFGTSGTPNLRSGDKCKILPPAQVEGFTMGSGMTGGEVWKNFTTSVVDWPVALSNTAAAESYIDGDPFTNALSDQWEASEDQLEAELVFGAYVEDTTGSTPLHATNGLLNFISTNAYVLPGWLSRMDLWDIIAEWKKFNKNGGAIVTSSEVVQLINTWAFDKMIYNQDLKADGIDIGTVKTPKGTFDLVECDLFSQEENLMGTILFLPNKGIDVRPLVGTMNREIGYKPVERDEIDRKEGQILGEQGYEFWGEETFAVATGIEF